MSSAALARRLFASSWWRLAVGLSGLAAGAGLIALALTDQQVPADVRAETILFVIGGWSFLAGGLIAWRRRPDNRIGAVMVGLGLAALGSELLIESTWSPLFTAGIWIADSWIVLFVFFLVSFPDGRLSSRADRLLVAPWVLAMVVLELPWLMFYDTGEPENALLVWPNADVADAIDIAGKAIGATAAVVLILVLAKRWMTATPPLRRILTPILAGAAAILIATTSVVYERITGEGSRALEWVVLGTLVAVPLAVLVDILRARLARSAVGDLVVELSAHPAPAEPRDALARALRDPSLTVAYWLPEYRTYADLDGRPVEVRPGPGRATKRVDRGGQPVAALLHDASLCEEPALLDAVAAAAGMALENARLHSDLLAHLEELKASRKRIVEAAQKERQRLERNLHDGAQQRLVSLSLELGLLEARFESDPEARQALDQARNELAESLQELRELARGIHPAVVTGHGLAVALETLAARSSVPVRLTVDLDARLPEAYEVATYYLVAESLTNVTKYAHASSADVAVGRFHGRLIVEVCDDGVGGADTDGGSGLRGLADRVEALGGRLQVWSPKDGGTRLRAEMPCG